MGQAKRRGNFEHRRREAIKRNKRLAIASLGEGDTQRQSELRLALDLFLKGLGPDGGVPATPLENIGFRPTPRQADLAERGVQERNVIAFRSEPGTACR